MSPGGSPVRVDRVVAVAATLRDGREQLGSGYLIGGRLVLTAEHCTRDKLTGESAARLRVVRASDGAVAQVAGVVPDHELDVAVLQLGADAPWETDLPRPVFARVDQSQSGVLDDCTGIGFPLFQRDPDRRTRHTSEFHGRIYQTDERESGRLLMREPLTHPGPVTGPGGEALSERGEEGSLPWGGLSGALMFYRGSAIGVVVEHHPRQGDNALLAIGFRRIAASAKIRQYLKLPEPDRLPWVSEQAAARPVSAGWPLAEVRDPFALEVHRPVQPDDPHDDLPALPAYVPREHDTELARVVQAAAGGSSGIATLVGGSSTGKTRACWEALQPLRDLPRPWRLWHPIDPTRPDAALRALPGIGPRTVVWLNEAQLYLDVAEAGLGEQVAAGLRELLRNPDRAPVLVLATLWPAYWHALTARPQDGPDLHAHARELLAGHDITVPAAFTPAQLQRLSQTGDARLAQAGATAQGGQVIQFLAGAPELLARYRNAPPSATALINAAMDARRLGSGIGLPQTFLAAAAPGYLTDTEWDALGEDWLEQALADTAEPCKGVRGPLTRIRPRPARSHPPGSHSGDSDEQLADGQASIVNVSLYRLADYLDQHGRRQRTDQIPPAGFWAAAADHALPADQAALGNAAHDRGLYRDATQLHKNAAARGNLNAGLYLINPPRCLRGDGRPVRWAIVHAPPKDPRAVARLLDDLRSADVPEKAATLADCAAYVSLDDPRAVAWLLVSLRQAGAAEQATALASRAAAHVSLQNPFDVAELLDDLRSADAREQADALASRAAAQAPLENPFAVARLLDGLKDADAWEQVTTLAGRAAAYASLQDPRAEAVARLLDSLRAAGMPEQAAALASRAAAHVPPNAYRMDDLLVSLRKADTREQFTTLASRIAAHVSLQDPGTVARLLDDLREVGARKQAAALLHRDPAAHVSLQDPDAVAYLLDELLEPGARKQAALLLHRDPAAHVSLHHPGAVTRLLDSLRKAGVDSLRSVATREQVTALADRAAAHVSLQDPGAVAALLVSLRKAGAREQAAALAGRAAAQAPLENPGAVVDLLDGLREAGAVEQAAALAGRAAARMSLQDPFDVARLLDRLLEPGAREQAAALLHRDPAAHVSLRNSYRVTPLLVSLRKAGAREQFTALAGRAAAHVSLQYPSGVAQLVDSLRAAGAPEQAAALVGRAAAQVPLEDPSAVAELLDRLRAAGAREQVAALLHRDPAAHVFLQHQSTVADLLVSLRKAGAAEQAAALADRLPGAGMFEFFRGQFDSQDRFGFGRETDGSPAEPWDWEDLD